MRSRLALVLLCGCATKLATTAVPRGPNAPPVATQPARVTCAEAAIILRGTVDDPKAAGPAKERVIAAACTEDKWQQDVITCAGSQPHPGNCIEGLTDEQHASYGKRLEAWNDTYSDEYVVYEETGWEPPPPPRVFSCRDGLGDAATYAPPITTAGEDRDFAIALRAPAIKKQCEASQWSQEVLKCLQDLPVETCRSQLDAPSQKALTEALATADKLTVKVGETKKKPAAFDCKKVVAAHYSDAAWKTKIADRKPKDRTKLIADSRAAMIKACSDDKWSANERACIVAGGGDACFVAANQSAVRWGFPALAVEARTGVPDCDLLIAHIEQFSRCDKASQNIRDAYKQAAEQMVAMWAQLPADQRAQAPAQCRQADEAIRSSAKSLGCPY